MTVEEGVLVGESVTVVSKSVPLSVVGNVEEDVHKEDSVVDKEEVIVVD